MSSRQLKNNLKMYRAKHGFTQESLAEKVFVARKTINVIEAGNYSPSVVLALAIAEALDEPVETIFYLD
ncbi:transcriptional regulator [Candidatus Saccharibacteria bacterium]|nr:MAG: transcriptional regulator [Candidatus Saccharibacteria bacterium]